MGRAAAGVGGGDILSMKTAWPEVVGWDGMSAVMKIHRDRPDVQRVFINFVRMSSEKASWPEVVGWPATAAVTQINSDRPDVSIEVIPDGATVPPGFSAKRVRVFFNAGDATGPVTRTPFVG
uniref:Uncharacterized protein n=1 Tax=Oryza brachyantha TaxID=4533 RepID=J3L965_ORYBR